MPLAHLRGTTEDELVQQMQYMQKAEAFAFEELQQAAAAAAAGAPSTESNTASGGSGSASSTAGGGAERSAAAQSEETDTGEQAVRTLARIHSVGSTRSWCL
jgi:mevalonate pyrophosphate decarboxylase